MAVFSTANAIPHQLQKRTIDEDKCEYALPGLIYSNNPDPVVPGSLVTFTLNTTIPDHVITQSTTLHVYYVNTDTAKPVSDGYLGPVCTGTGCPINANTPFTAIAKFLHKTSSIINISDNNSESIAYNVPDDFRNLELLKDNFKSTSISTNKSDKVIVKKYVLSMNSAKNKCHYHQSGITSLLQLLDSKDNEGNIYDNSESSKKDENKDNKNREIKVSTS
ncbi:9122_t:CDS:2, partial [Funneliformis mosseae]